jgi:hydrogenase maturation factor
VLAAVSPKARDEVEDVLRQSSVKAKFLGSFTEKMRWVLVKNGEETVFPREA